MITIIKSTLTIAFKMVSSSPLFAILERIYILKLKYLTCTCDSIILTDNGEKLKYHLASSSFKKATQTMFKTNSLNLRSSTSGSAKCEMTLHKQIVPSCHRASCIGMWWNLLYWNEMLALMFGYHLQDFETKNFCTKTL